MHLFITWCLHHLGFFGSQIALAGVVGFASIPSVVSGGDAGAAGGAGGENVGGDAAISDGGDSSESGGAGEVDAASSSSEEGQGASAAQAQGGEELVDSGDGRMIPAKYRDLFKSDKLLKGLFFQDRALKQEFPGGVKEAIAAKQTLEKFGGEAGIAELNTEVEEFRATDQMFLKGDAGLIDRLAEINPESFVKLTQNAIAKFAALDKDQYNYTMGRIVFNTLRGMEGLHSAYNFLANLKDSPEAKQLAQQLADEYNGIKDLASKVPEKKVDAREEDFKRREQAFTEREQKAHVTSINNQVFPKLVTSIENQLRTEMKAVGRNLDTLKKSDPESYKLLLANCLQQVKNAVLSDATHVRNYNAVLNEKNLAKAVKMLDGKHAKVLPDAVTKVFKAFSGGAVAKKTNTQRANSGGGNQGAQGFLQVAEKPNRFDIDWEKSKDLMLDQKAILKDGKKVTWAGVRAG